MRRKSRHTGARLFRAGLLGVLLAAGAAAGSVSFDAPPDDPASPAAASEPASNSMGWEAIEKEIRDSEYRITWQEQTSLADLPRAWQAPNRAQRFRSYFTESGIRVIPRAAGTPEWEWGLALAGIGRGDRIAPAGAAILYPRGERIEYRREKITEEYRNEPRGIVQRFTLALPPGEPASSGLAWTRVSDEGGRGMGSAGEGEPLRLVLAMGGTLSAYPAADGLAIDFAAAGRGPVLRHAGLVASDALGRELPVRMEAFVDAQTRGIRLSVEDQEAAYPLVIDSLLTNPAWTAESDQAGAQLGFAAATAGDVNGDGASDVVVGAPFYDNGQTDEGRTFVFLGSPSGLSVAPAWTAESDQAGAQFGFSVATAGDVNGDGTSDVVVGAPFYDNGQADEGRAFIYHGSASGLSATAAWTGEVNQAAAQFGTSVAAAGDVNSDGRGDLIVGAPFYDNGQADEGVAFVYHGSTSGLALSPSTILERDKAGAEMGCAVSTAGDMNGDGFSDVLVGARRYNYTFVDEGAVWFYPGSASGLVTGGPRGIIGGQAGALYGSAVAAAGDMNGDGYADGLVGAPKWDDPEVDEGVVEGLFGEPGGPITAPGFFECDQAGAEFGASISTAGDVNGDGFSDIIIGAPKFDNGQTDEGRAFLYYGWLPGSAQWSAEGDQAGARFGQSVALAGDVDGDGLSDVIVGAPLVDNGQADEGRVRLYRGSREGLVGDTWSAESDQGGAQLGFSLAAAGDVNGDGYGDVIVGAPYFDNGQVDEGRAFLYCGAASGLPAASCWGAESNQASANLGYSVAGAGDVNGDGFADVIVGAWKYDNGQTDEGRAFLYHGSASGLSTAASWTAESDQASAYFGASVGTAGDANGDGLSDVIVGSPNFDNGQADEGRAFLYHGSASGLSTAASWMAESNQASAFFGTSVATAGDVNADGFSDVVVGAPKFDNGQGDEGRAFAYHGSVAGLSLAASWTAESDQGGANFGTIVSTAGDANGDGYSDVIVGAPLFDNGATDEGMAMLYYGSASGLAAAKGWSAEGEQTGAHLGHCVGTAGDVNSDGYSEVFATADLYDITSPAMADAGMALVFYGSATGPRTTGWDYFIWGEQAGAHFGDAAATAGDVNGDGYADFIVSAALQDNGQADEGRFYLHLGGGWAHGSGFRPQQRRVEDSAPIAPLGISDSLSSFRLAAGGRTPFGPGRVRLEWEVKPLGILFNGTGTGRGAAWTATGTAGVSLNEPVTGLAPDTVYHWRARVRYEAASLPFQPAGPWFSAPANGWQEADLRTSKIVDGDGDGRFSDVDCNDANPAIWGTPGEVTGVVFGTDGMTLSWSAAADPGGLLSALAYDSLRSGSPADFVSGICVESNGGDTSSQDAAIPALETLFAYLVRAENACPNGQGPLGNQSSGTPRIGRSCP